MQLILKQTDCLDLLQTINDNSIDLIATDPPYFRVKADDWDRQWDTQQEFTEWLSSVVKEFARVLKPTGSLYLFCGPYLAAETELLINEHMRVLNHIVWRKPTGRHLGCHIPGQRKYFPQTERIIFAESYKKIPFGYEAIRSYIDNSVEISRKKVDEITGTKMSGHWFGRSQFSIPSKEHYETLQTVSPGLKLPYLEFYNWYCKLRDGEQRSRRYFRAQKGINTDVWDFKVVQPYKGKHPCEKPLDLMAHIIDVSTQENDVVLDTFVGSGSTAIAALNSGRKFIGCEFGKDEFKIAEERIKRETNHN